MDAIDAAEHGLTSTSIVTGPELIACTAFVSLALYNFVELMGSIFATFKKCQGLYFWSMIVASGGIAVNAVGILIKFNRTSDSRGLMGLYITLADVGWCAMVTGFSVVLFSRLHLLVHDLFTIRFVLTMIIFDAALVQPPTLILFGLVNWTDPGRFAIPFFILDKLQNVIFFVQEFIISVIFVIKSVHLLRGRAKSSSSPGRTGADMSEVRWVLYWLIGIITVAFLLNISVLGFAIAGSHVLESSWRPLVYSIKLKLLFGILNRLLAIAGAVHPDLTENQYYTQRKTPRREVGKSFRSDSITIATRFSRPKVEDDDDDLEKDDIVLPMQSHFSEPSSVSTRKPLPSPKTKDQNSSHVFFF